MLSAFTGIGIAWFLYIFNKIRKSNDMPAFLSIVLCAVLAVALPAVPLREHWFTHDRSRNWTPRDYAYNILMSCPPNSILFTNGDNDTFPLWYLQTVEKIRTDVRIANLSLINTPWYIWQLKNLMDVPITISDEQIEQLRAYRNPRTGEVVRVQDLMVKHIIDNTRLVPVVKMSDSPEALSSGSAPSVAETTYTFDPPICFAVTVASENKLNYADFMKMDGLVYTLTTVKGSRQVDVDAMKRNLFEVYEYRGLTDDGIYKDENTDKLLQNYITSFMTLAMAQEERGDSGAAVETMERAMQILSYRWELYAFAGDVFSRYGMKDKIDAMYEEVIRLDPTNQRLIGMFGHFYRRFSDNEKSMQVLKDAYTRSPDNREAMLDLVRGYYLAGMQAEMQNVLSEWQSRFPKDDEINRLLSQPIPPSTQTIQPGQAVTISK